MRPETSATLTPRVAEAIVKVNGGAVIGRLVRPFGAWNAEAVTTHDVASGGEGIVRSRPDLDGERRIRGEEVGSGFVLRDAGPEAGTFTRDVRCPPAKALRLSGPVLVLPVTLVPIARS